MTSVNQKRIVLTGVSRGLGRAMAEGFIREGHIVAGCARSKEAIGQLAQHHEPPHAFEVVDVTRDAKVRAWADRVLSEGGAPDLLINNAGLINRNAPLWEVPAEEFSRVIDANIKGVANVLRHFVPVMVKRNCGVIVNISSGWGRSAAPEVAPYCATKSALKTTANRFQCPLDAISVRVLKFFADQGNLVRRASEAVDWRQETNASTNSESHRTDFKTRSYGASGGVGTAGSGAKPSES